MFSLLSTHPRATRAILAAVGFCLSSLIALPLVLGQPAASTVVAVNVTPLARYSGGTYLIEIQGGFAFAAEGFGLTVLDLAVPSQPTPVAATGPFYSAITGLALSGGLAYATEGAGTLHVFDISDPIHPLELATFDTTFALTDIALEGGYAFVTTNGDGLRVLSVSDLNAIAEVGHYNTPGTDLSVAVAGGIAYVADRGSGLRILNVSDPAHPISLTAVDTPGDAVDVQVQGQTLFLADGTALRLYDVTNPAAPITQGVWSGGAWKITLAGGRAFLGAGPTAFSIVDVSDVSAPVLVASRSDQHIGNHLAVAGNYLYAPHQSPNIKVYDIGDPAMPVAVGGYTTPGTCQLGVDDTTLYLATGPLTIADFADPQHPTVVGQSSPHGLGQGNRVRVVGSRAYVASDQLHIFDVSDPADPHRVGLFDPIGFVWDVDLKNNLAYLGTASGLVIVDVANPTNPIEEGSYTEALDARRVWVAALNGSLYAFVASRSSGGLFILNVDVPSEPTLVAQIASLTSNGYSDVVVADDYAYAVETGAGIRVIDIRDMAHITTVRTVPFVHSPGGPFGLLNLAGGRLFLLTKSGVPTDLESVRIYDLGNPDDPVEVSAYAEVQGKTVEVAGATLYIPDCGGGVQAFSFTAPIPTPTPTPQASPTAPSPVVYRIFVPSVWREPYSDIALP